MCQGVPYVAGFEGTLSRRHHREAEPGSDSRPFQTDPAVEVLLSELEPSEEVTTVQLDRVGNALRVQRGFKVVDVE